MPPFRMSPQDAEAIAVYQSIYDRSAHLLNSRLE